MNPVHYGLCRQSVTVYRRQDGQLRRTVLHNVFLEYRRKHRWERTGEREETGFLLIVPGAVQQVFPGDRILPGEGPESPDWAGLTRGNYPGLCVAAWAEQKFWDGKAVHTEAGA